MHIQNLKIVLICWNNKILVRPAILALSLLNLTKVLDLCRLNHLLNWIVKGYKLLLNDVLSKFLVFFNHWDNYLFST